MTDLALFSSPVLTAFGVTLAAGLATVLGALFVARADPSNPRLLSVALAFSGGAMVYVSLVEIFGKSVSFLSEAHGDRTGYAFATLALFGGIALLVLLDRLVPNPHAGLDARDDAGRAALARVGLVAALAITAHNLPEGLATFFATLDDPVVGASLGVAIALHNIPEGVSVAVPVFYATGSRRRAVQAAFLSGLAEPAGALLGYLVLAPFLSPTLLGVLFGAIAGVMVFLALDELLPTAKRYAAGHETAYGMVGGMGVLALSLVLLR